MAFALPRLPYDYEALEPYIDAETMRLHHDKHHQTYVTNANNALEGTEWADRPVEEVLQNLDQLSDEKRNAVRNNAGGHYNHSLFWEWMSPDGGGEPDGELREALDSAWLLCGLQGQAQGRRRRPVRLGLGISRARRLEPGGDLYAQPGQPDLGRHDAAVGRRRLGARLLPQVPEQAARLHRRLVERRQLAEGRAELRGHLRGLERRSTRMTVTRAPASRRNPGSDCPAAEALPRFPSRCFR